MDTISIETQLGAFLDGYIDKSELARQLGVSERTVDRYTDLPDGLPFVKLGRRRLFDVAQCRQWLADRTITRNPSH